MEESGVDRRVVLGAGAGALLGIALSGCSDTRREQGSSGAARSRLLASGEVPRVASLAVEDADVDLAVSVLVDEATLLLGYQAVLRAHRELRTRLRPLIAGQQSHVDVLTESLGDSPAAQIEIPAPAPGASRPDTIRPRAAAAAEQRLDDCLAASSGALARALASMAACHAVTAADWDKARR